MRGKGCFGIAGGFAPVGWLLPVNLMLLPVMRRGVAITGGLILLCRPVVALGCCLCLLPTVMARGFLCCRGVGRFSPSSRSISRHTSLDFSQ